MWRGILVILIDALDSIFKKTNSILYLSVFIPLHCWRNTNSFILVKHLLSAASAPRYHIHNWSLVRHKIKFVSLSQAFMNRSLLRSHMSVHYKSRLSKNGEEESDTELPSRKGRYIHLKTLAALQQSGATENTMKNFTILIKRKSYIERAARDGFTGPFTYVQYRCNGKLAGQWVKASKQ